MKIYDSSEICISSVQKHVRFVVLSILSFLVTYFLGQFLALTFSSNFESDMSRSSRKKRKAEVRSGVIARRIRDRTFNRFPWKIASRLSRLSIFAWHACFIRLASLCLDHTIQELSRIPGVSRARRQSRRANFISKYPATKIAGVAADGSSLAALLYPDSA